MLLRSVLSFAALDEGSLPNLCNKWKEAFTWSQTPEYEMNYNLHVMVSLIWNVVRFSELNMRSEEC